MVKRAPLFRRRGRRISRRPRIRIRIPHIVRRVKDKVKDKLKKFKPCLKTVCGLVKNSKRLSKSYARRLILRKESKKTRGHPKTAY